MPDSIEPSVGAQASDEGAPMDGESDNQPRRACALVFAGGTALGAYEAGALAALEKAGDPAVEWIAGSSIGAVTAAIIAGNPPERRLERLRRFWDTAAVAPNLMSPFWLGRQTTDSMRRAYNWAAVVRRTFWVALACSNRGSLRAWGLRRMMPLASTI